MQTGVASWSRSEALNTLLWLQEAGVDIIVSDEPQPWLREDGGILQPDRVDIDQVIEKNNDNSSSVESARPAASLAITPELALIVKGDAASRIAVAMDVDPKAGNGNILTGAEAQLLGRMLAAIGLDSDKVIHLGIPAGADAKFTQMQFASKGTDILLLMGDGPCRALLGKAVGQVRGQVHQLDIGNRKMSVVATFAPRYLLRQQSAKALAWADLKLFLKLVQS